MSWIKDNKFNVGLGGITLVLVLALYFFGSSGSSRFEEAQEVYQTAASEVASFEKGKLYPTKENVDGKQFALDEYRNATDELQKAFERFRIEEPEPMSPQAFSDALKQADEETRKAFGEETIIPADYYCGFEVYTKKMASGKATGILNYELQAVKKLMLELADSGVSELINIYRPALPEEVSGQPFKPEKNQVARGLPLEITFKGSEKSVNNFMSALANADQHYVVVRSMRILNTKQIPPKTTDAKFEKPEVKGGGAAGIFGELLDAPGNIFDQEPSTPEPTTDDAPAEAPVAPVIPDAPRDSSRNLAQVLGNEELQVFLRLDLMKFLPAKELP